MRRWKEKNWRAKDKECNESKTACNNQVTKFEIDIESLTKIKLEYEGEWKTCEGKLSDWTTKYNQCTSAKSILEVTITNINKKTVLDCKDTTTIITNQLTNCKQDIEKGIAKYDQCNKTNITLKVEIEKQITIISNVTKECQGKIDKKITDIRDEEK